VAVEGARIDHDASFVHFVYPFLFEADTFAKRVATIRQAQWQGRERPLTVWQTDRFPEDELLPHVARYLNSGDGTSPTAQMWEMERNTLQSPSGLGGQAEWHLTLPQGQVPFRFEAVRLALFRVGVGFLTVCANPLTAEKADWLDFLHYFRFIRGQRDVGLRAQRRIGLDTRTRQPQISAFFPEPAGGVAQHPDGKGIFQTILDTMLQTGAFPSETRPWWDEVFVLGQLLPFAALYVDEMPTDQVPCLLYRIRNFFHARQEIYPASEDLRLDHPAHLPYAEGLWFLFSLDGGAFVACNAPRTDFFRVQLPDHLSQHYFLLFLLTLHQRFALMKLSEEVAKHWPIDGDTGDDEARERAFGRIRDALLSFTARGYFTQVMQREHHHRCYRRWQETFQVDRLYQEVRDEVQEMHNFLVMRRTERLKQLAEEQRQQMETEAREDIRRERTAQERARRLEERISLLGVGIGVPSLIFGFLSINLYGITAKDEGLSLWLALLIGTVGGGLLGWLVLWLLRRQTRSGDVEPKVRPSP